MLKRYLRQESHSQSGKKAIVTAANIYHIRYTYTVAILTLTGYQFKVKVIDRKKCEESRAIEFFLFFEVTDKIGGFILWSVVIEKREIEG